MVSLIAYIIKMNIAVAVLYLLYVLFFSKLSFYSANRFFLLWCIIGSFILPAIHFNTDFFQKKTISTGVIYRVVNTLANNKIIENTIQSHQETPVQQIMYLILCAGMVFFFTRLVLRMTGLLQMLKKARPYTVSDNVAVYLLEKKIVPFSFLNRVFINPSIYPEKDLNLIISHEKVHVQQAHSFDILLSEIFVIINWFNPVSWLLKKEITQNLEYIADQVVIKKGFDREAYQLCLLSVTTGKQVLYPVNFFTLASFRKRLFRMNRSFASHPANILKYLLVLPVCMTVLLLNSFTIPVSFTFPLNKAKDANVLPGNTASKMWNTAGIKQNEPLAVAIPKTVPLQNPAKKEAIETTESNTDNTDLTAIPPGAHWNANMVDNIIVWIYGTKISIEGNNGVATIRNRDRYPQEVIIKEFPSAKFYFGGHVYALTDFASIVPVNKIKKTTIYLGKYATELFGDEGKNGIVVFEFNK
jgi:hypothetical protein